jgi:hypothetical protein
MLSSVTKYGEKSNPTSGWRTTAWLAGSSTRAWVDHLLRNFIDSWEDLREIFTGNFLGIYMHLDNPWNQKGC